MDANQQAARFIASGFFHGRTMYQLQRSDLKNSTWKRFEKGLEARLQELRESNDSPANDELKTSLIRGQIKLVKELLALSSDSARADDFPSDGEVDP